MTKYHLSSDGTPGVCKAIKKPCPLADSPHIELTDKDELKIWSENQNELLTSQPPRGFKTAFREVGKLEQDGGHYGGDYSLTDGWSRRFVAQRTDGKYVTVTEMMYPVITDPRELERYEDYKGDRESFREANPDFQGEPWLINLESYTEISDPTENVENFIESSGVDDSRETHSDLVFDTAEKADESAKRLIMRENPNTWF